MLAGFFEFLLEEAMLFIEGGYVCALKRIDRLFFIPNDKQGAPARPCAFTCGKFGRKQFDHAPLVGAGILRLIDKDMVDAAIQPEQHPGGNVGIGQQQLGAGDQIVEIKETARGLGGLINRQEAGGKAVQQGGFLRRLQGDATGPGGFYPQHQGIELRQMRGDQLLRRLGRQAADFRAKRRFRATAKQQNVLQR
ncbi:MAG: hypothetical protein ACD_54C01211G0002 [uncultured bacterium]|nr:MAG: hypothetical protein ACD_54C01211G0002 [uncultured bacterium]